MVMIFGSARLVSSLFIYFIFFLIFDFVFEILIYMFADGKFNTPQSSHGPYVVCGIIYKILKGLLNKIQHKIIKNQN